MQRQCAQCGKPFEAQRPTAKYCGSTCRATASKSRVPPPPPPPPPAAETDSERTVTGLVDSVQMELEALHRLNTVTGQHALELANRIVSAPGMNAGVASLSKELSRVLAEVRASAPSLVADPLDELEARRVEKLKRATG